MAFGEPVQERETKRGLFFQSSKTKFERRCYGKGALK